MMERDLASFSTWQYVVPNSASSCRAESGHPVKLPVGRAGPLSAPLGMTVAF